MNNVSRRCLLTWLLVLVMSCGMQTAAADDEPASGGGENASNPLAAARRANGKPFGLPLPIEGSGQ